MTTGTDERVITIYTIHNNESSDCDCDIPEITNENRLDLCYDDYCECALEIGNEIMEQFDGTKEHKVKIKLIYTKDFCWDYGVYEYDLDYEYEIIESKSTDYWE